MCRSDNVNVSNELQKSNFNYIFAVRKEGYVLLFNAGIAQLVEHDLAKVGVASSSLVFRS